jgi:hypothetical protein
MTFKVVGDTNLAKEAHVSFEKQSVTIETNE